LPETIRLSRRTHAVLWQNIALALGIKAAFMALALFGSATMWMAVFADMGATLIVVANGLRLLRTQAGPEV
jgi:Cd2+/Zn2+-exporting ATPase